MTQPRAKAQPAPSKTVHKWCHHCGKDTHDDAECWSTRQADLPPVTRRAPNAPIRLDLLPKTPQQLFDMLKGLKA